MSQEAEYLVIPLRIMHAPSLPSQGQESLSTVRVGEVALDTVRCRRRCPTLSIGPLTLALHSDAFLAATFLVVGVGLAVFMGTDRLDYVFDNFSGLVVVLFFLVGFVGWPVVGLLAGGLLYLLFGLLYFAFTRAWVPLSNYWLLVFVFNVLVMLAGLMILIRVSAKLSLDREVPARKGVCYVLVGLVLCGLGITVRDLVLLLLL